MKQFSWLLLVTALVTLPACVTINIYFPAASAEKAADKIIDEVWQIKPSEHKPAEAAEPQPETSQ
jgi:hypothetical protein